MIKSNVLLFKLKALLTKLPLRPFFPQIAQRWGIAGYMGLASSALKGKRKEWCLAIPWAPTWRLVSILMSIVVIWLILPLGSWPLLSSKVKIRNLVPLKKKRGPWQPEINLENAILGGWRFYLSIIFCISQW